MIVVIVVLEVRRVTVYQRVPVLVEPVKDPEPGEAAEAVRPKLVKRARLVEGEALVRDAVAAAACGFGGGSCECSVRRGVGIEEEPRGARWEWTARRTPARRRVSRDLGFPRSGSKGELGEGGEGTHPWRGSDARADAARTAARSDARPSDAARRPRNPWRNAPPSCLSSLEGTERG